MQQYVASGFSETREPYSNIVIVDNNSMTPYAVTKLLARHSSLTVVGHACDGISALGLCRKTGPDMVIIDPLLPGLDGLSVIHQLRRINPKLKILVYCLENRQHSAADYINTQVDAIVLKNSPITTLVAAINTVAAGNKFLDQMLSPIEHIVNSSTSQPNSLVTLPHLSPREKQILKMIVEGVKNKDIANILFLSVKTIESHRLNMMRKLDAHSIFDLIRWAHRLNISH
jgi:two-component system secretion response regulator SsrB